MVMEDFGAVYREERKAKPQCKTQITRKGRIVQDLCASVSAVQSVFHNFCPSLKNRASKTKVSAFICVHPQFFKNVIPQTGLTGSIGYIFNLVHLVILSNSKRHLPAPEKSAILREGAI